MLTIPAKCNGCARAKFIKDILIGNELDLEDIGSFSSDTYLNCDTKRQINHFHFIFRWHFKWN